jgi:hypothetical protein
MGQFEPKYSDLGADADLWWVVPFSVRYIVGVSGLRFAGKSTALSYLADKRGFSTYSLTGELRRIAQVRGIAVSSRESLQDLGDELRAEHGDGGFLARLTLERIRADHLHTRGGLTRIAVGGFKHPKEVAVFNQLADAFHFLRVLAGERVRYARAAGNGILARELTELGIPFTGVPGPSLFRWRLEERDRRGQDWRPWTRGYGQSMDKTVTSGINAHEIRNSGTDYGPLYNKLDAWIDELDALHRRPDI